MSESPFRQRAVVWIVGLCGVSLLAALVFILLGDELAPVESHQSDAYSRSALGHQAFVELLQRLGVPVIVSRHESVVRAGDGAVLAVLEPRLRHVEDDPSLLLDSLRSRVGPNLVVLPKYEGWRQLEEPAWIARADLVDLDEVEALLERVGVSRAIVRPEGALGPDVWQLGDPALTAAPTLSRPQLIERGLGAATRDWRPLVWSDAGVLVAETRTAYDAPLVIVSDPDLFATHGLASGDNAVMAVQIVDYLRESSAPLLLDETLHGHASHPTLWKELFEFPLVVAVLHALVLLAFVGWLAMRRFGAPQPAPPAIERGKGFLIDNTAELLRYGGHSGHTLRRYWFNTLQDVGQTLNAPAQLNSVELRTWLAELAARRGVTERLENLATLVNSHSRAAEGRQARAVLRVARRIHDWRREMIDGPRRNHSPS